MNVQTEAQIQQLYEDYHQEIFRYIFMMIGERQQARDLMQETFIKAFLNIESFRGDASYKTWLYRIARNVTIDYQRRKKPGTYILDHLAPMKSDQATPEEIALLGDDVEQLYIALSRLKKGYRDVIMLRKIREFSVKETATIMGWKESRVKTALHRGLNALRDEMKKEGYRSETIRF
ncbi:RNA polymerase sigma factor [Ornithinibacillus halotolerans]|uniref:ECF RNA polymerase sigma factor SigW n=1 Tax=Ornithinibacillus halotolerans TaxID=1274357 RepID=A0A916W232_9BACI|nr:RNA polymerase sigma factor [Ornithinibacillus halotolerans]GGA60128.1 ECF RNA polymerase sigma factor SigW [Ornithinibacillus halotolerans]